DSADRARREPGVSRRVGHRAVGRAHARRQEAHGPRGVRDHAQPEAVVVLRAPGDRPRGARVDHLSPEDHRLMAMSAKKILRELARPAVFVRILIAVAAAIGIYLGIDAWIGGRTTVPVALGDRPITLLDPTKLLLVAIVPFLFLLRVLSLTDLSVLQQ